jgi:hypothetical protein
VFGLNPLPGRLDLLVSSELLETARQIGNGLAFQHSHPGDHLVVAHADHRRKNADRRRSAE